ncbi:MAG: ABC transporter substrate-binding protein [Dehalococcoidales bacterium]
MKKGVIWIALTFLIVASMALASCNSSTTTSTPTATTTASVVTTTTSTTTISSATTTSTSAVTTAVTTTSTGNWWDSMGTPQYGGVMTMSTTADFVDWDPYMQNGSPGCYVNFMEQLFCDDYRIDPSVFDYAFNYLPPDYAFGYMLTNWTMQGTTTFTVQLRTDIYWQNIAPVNGRQFTSADVVYHYDRLLGLGDGFTTRDPYMSTGWNPLLSISAPDKYTAVFTFAAGTNPLSSEILLTTVGGGVNSFEASEAVAAYTTASNPAIIDWHHSIGTGPWVVTDFVDGSSVTFAKNPTYWAYDQRWPQNRLPYMDGEVILIIPSQATGEAALRSGKIAGLTVTYADASSILKTNPEMSTITSPGTYELSVDPRVDLAPFNSLQVRQAMQASINIPLIAQTLYNGYASTWPVSLTENQLAASGWGFPYPQWPASLQAEYAFNTTNAKALLAAAGYPNGFNTNCLLTSSNSIANGDLYQVIQSEFAAIGINMSITVMPDATWNSICLGAGRSYPALCARFPGCTGTSSDPFTELSKFTTGNMTDIPNVSDPKIDAWKAQALAATTVAQVQQILHDENLYIAQQHFEICVAQPEFFFLLQPWVHGVTGPPGAGWPWMPGYFPNGNWIDTSS